MNKIARRLIGALLMTVMVTSLQAQEAAMNPDNADMMRSNGKIYVVVAVVLTILVALFFYVFTLDRKISRMEKKEVG